MKKHDLLTLRLVSRRHQAGDQRRIVLNHLRRAPQLDPPSVAVVDQEQVRLGVLQQIAAADELAVAPKIGKGNGRRIQHPEKTRRAATVLDVRLAGSIGGGEKNAGLLTNEDGQIIPETAVTVSRVSRLIDELARFGIVLAPETEWDYVNGCRFPKHIIITEEGWRLTGVDMDKLRAEQEERLRAIEDGILQPGEAMTVKEARKRWYERCRHQTILSRRTRAIEGKQRRKLAELPFDERKRQVAERIFRDMKGDIHHLTPQQFEKMVWTQLYQLELVNMEQPGAAPPH